MKILSIDIETYSSTDLSKCGVYHYTEAPDFEILLFGYSIDGDEVQVVDIANGEKLPPDVLAALSDDAVTKWAFNAQFERICLSRYLRDINRFDNTGYSILQDTVGDYLNPEAWRCTMVWSAYMGLPLSLEGVGAVLGLEKQKPTEGKDLIRYFCVPCNSTTANGQRTRNRCGNGNVNTAEIVKICCAGHHLGRVPPRPRDMDSQIEYASVLGNAVTFHFRDGHEVTKTFEDKRRGTKWTEERKLNMSQRMTKNWRDRRVENSHDDTGDN
jgi:hypothetical protein